MEQTPENLKNREDMEIISNLAQGLTFLGALKGVNRMVRPNAIIELLEKEISPRSK